ncbi:MAG: DUF3392 family protein [Paraglaciecola sp.]|nr:DUF3392 family protein [Paraglaciecola sp.]
MAWGDIKLISWGSLRLRAQHFIVRTSVFVLVCAFGYGLLTVYATPFVKLGLNMIPVLYRGISIVGVFLLLGYLAEHRRYI